MTQTSNDTKRVVGVFGGSFSPPHVGHALLPSYVLQCENVDEVLVVPCYEHAFEKALLPFRQRLHWLKSVFQGHDKIRVSGIEASLAWHLGRAPRSLEVLQCLQAQEPTSRFRWIVGQDIIDSGETAKWHRWDLILKEFEPIVVPRPRGGGPLPSISSSQLREKLALASVEQELVALRPWLPRAVLSDWDLYARQFKTHGDGCDEAEDVDEARVWIVGQGRAGRVIANRLEQSGVASISMSARNVLQQTVDVRELPRPNLVWYAGRDADADAVTRGLADALDDVGDVKSVIFAHASGAVRASDLLSGVAARGCTVASIHPIQSLTGEIDSSFDVSHAWGIEGPQKLFNWVRAWASSALLIDLSSLSADERVAYHAACALAANYLAGLRGSAVRVWESIGIETKISERSIGVLMQGALRNLLRLGVPAGMSGPLVRGDEQALDRHRTVYPAAIQPLFDALMIATRVELQRLARGGE